MSEVFDQWLSSPIGLACADYTRRGWYLFPVHGVVNNRCTCGKFPCGDGNKQAGKHPATARGFKDSCNEIHEVAELFKYRSDYNIGVATGHSGFFILDVDIKNSGDLALDELCRVFGEMPPTRVSITGNGFHVFFKNPNFKVQNGTRVFGADYPGLDIRGTGGYIVLPPSRHFSGNQYHFPDDCPDIDLPAPEWLLDAIKPKEKAPEALAPIERDTASGELPQWDREQIARMLSFLDPSMAYDDWLHIGMALHEGGFPLSMWDEWSRKSTKYVNKDCEKRWRGFSATDGITMGTLVEKARLAGWAPDPVPRRESDVSSVEPLDKKAMELIKPLPAADINAPTCLEVLGFNPLSLPGLIGDTTRWITRHAILKQPELALLNVLAFCGAVFGRRYKSPTGIRPNVYMAGVAPTGAGKDASRKAITMLALAAGLQDMLGGNSIRSDTGMLRGLCNNASQLLMLDEFGLLLQAISGKNAPGYMRSITATLLTLYSSSGSVYHHGDYADARTKPIIINYPNLCIYGTTTESSFLPDISKASIDSGKLNRFIIVPAPKNNALPERRVPECVLPVDLRDAWEMFKPKLGDSLGTMGNNADLAPEAQTVAWGECEDIFYNIFVRQEKMIALNTISSPLWGRLAENTLKLAMIFAIARNYVLPEFKEEDFNLGQMIVERSINYLSSTAENRMSESPQEEANNDILIAIRAKGGSMTRSEVLRKFRKYKKRELDDVLGSMIDQEVIQAVAEKSTTPGRHKTIYSLVLSQAA